jgi:hypothetical protein
VVSCAALAAACASSPPPATVSDIPVSLRTPPNLLLTLQAHAVGTQIYQCGAASNDSALYVWTLKAPDATLFDKNGKKIGKHYAGPTWEANDGSTVVGEVAARENSPNGDSIPWLLLSAKTTTGRGLFSAVKFVQRLHTVGGKAPDSGCSAAQFGAERRVKYSADYFFYIAARP